jgi:hypothetical protein
MKSKHRTWHAFSFGLSDSSTKSFAKGGKCICALVLASYEEHVARAAMARFYAQRIPSVVHMEADLIICHDLSACSFCRLVQVRISSQVDLLTSTSSQQQQQQGEEV